MTAGGTPPLDDLYRELVLEHFRNPRRRGSLAEPTGHYEGFNPICGDEISLDLRLDGREITDVAFQGSGCSISQASASMLADRIAGHDAGDARHLIEAVRTMLQSGEAPPEDLGDLEALAGVSRFPVRVKCALLSWNVLEQGLNELEQVA